jgi:hypothetical protein
VATVEAPTPIESAGAATAREPKASRTAPSTPDAEPKISSKALPPVPDKNCPIDQALQWWADADTLHPGRLIGYLYRLHPICKTKPSYIEIFPQPVTYQQILQERGSGEYKLHINDKDKSKWGEIIITRWKTKEHWTEYPPVLDPATLDLDHKDNKSYVEWLKSRGAGMAPNGNGGSDAAAVNALAQTVQALLAEVRKPKEPGSDAAAFSKLADMFSAGHKASLDMALGQVKANSDEETIKRLTMMQALFAPKTTEAKPGSSTMETYLLQKLQAADARAEKLVDRLLDLQTKPGAADSDSLTKTLMPVLVQRFVDSLDSGGGKEYSGKWGWLQMLQPEISKTLDLVGMMARRGAATNPFRQQQAQPGPAAQPEVLPGLPATEPQPQTAQPMTEDQKFVQDFGQFLLEAWRPMCTFIKSGRPGAGVAFGDHVAIGNGFNVADHDRIKAFGRDKIIAMVREQGGEAALKLEGITMERFSAFLDDFLTWEPADEEPPDGGPVEPGTGRPVA